MASIEPSYNANRIVLGEKLPLDTPLSVILDVSEICNFKCNYCFRSGKKDESWGFAATNENMPFETFKLAVRQLAQFPHKIKLVSLAGQGEPLCNPHLAEMTRQLKAAGVTERIDMHTNASLFTEANVEEIANSGFTRIVISLQGLDAPTYERVCGAKINWDHFYHNLKLLYENKDEHLKLHIKISNMALDNDRYQEDERRFYSIFGDISDSMYVEKAVPIWKNLGIIPDQKVNKYGNYVGTVNYCSLAFYKIVITPSGTIYPCPQLIPPVNLGNIHNITIQEAWNSQKRYDFLKEHLRLTRYKQKTCLDCFIPVNTITSNEDFIDPYKEKILRRLEEQF